MKWFTGDEVKELKMIPSDQWLVLNKMDSIVDMIQEVMGDDDNKLSMSFKRSTS